MATSLCFAASMNSRRAPAKAETSVSSTYTAHKEENDEAEITLGYTLAQFCDKMIEVFMHEKPQTKNWRKLLVFRDEWNKYREGFYNRCQARADSEHDPMMKQKLIALARKVKKIDNEMDQHTELLKEIQGNPTDINAIVARRRKDFTGEFFRHLAIARLGAKCLSAVSTYDNALENVEDLNIAQSKFNEILNSPSLDAACERVKDIMYHIYKTTKSSLRSIAPKEIKILKYLLNITDPEERFSALATAFSPGDDREAKDADVMYTTPKELHKWIKIMLDAYLLNKEETELREARQLTQPVVIQRLFILKETIETEYMKQGTTKAEKDEEPEE
ncbi:Uncharacterized protein QJS10_CPB17g02451 [Acorus calamus]|uniref:Uncharacterized protein n=1 Tax=Acorus calamus TaxID=4465 RepID=A0AAV9CVC2_ACOCL|nr:Uncharacterized protein QJS10_CPB17g02451 [Acorus calamus]